MAKFKQELKSADETRKKAGITAVRVEAFRLQGVLRKEIRAGAPGGHRFSVLRVITRGNRRRRPLRGLARWVYYWVTTQSGTVTNISVGFGGKGLKSYSSMSILKIAKLQQEGFSASADSATTYSTLRKFFRRLGAKYVKAGSKRVAKFFFLKKSTSTLKTPARPIIDPFWDAHKMEAWKNIKSNFNRKLAGERI